METAENGENTDMMTSSRLNRDELAVVYSAAILADDDVTITAEKLVTLMKAANLTDVEPIWPTLYARALGSGYDVKRLLTSFGAMAASATGATHTAPAATQSTGGTALHPDDKKPVAEPEVDDDDDDDDLNLDLFN